MTIILTCLRMMNLPLRLLSVQPSYGGQRSPDACTLVPGPYFGNAGDRQAHASKPAAPARTHRYAMNVCLKARDARANR